MGGGWLMFPTRKLSGVPPALGLARLEIGGRTSARMTVVTTRRAEMVNVWRFPLLTTGCFGRGIVKALLT